MKGNKLIHVMVVSILFALFTPSAVFSYTVLWDTSHGVADSGQYQPSGYYKTLAEHLGNNGFTVATTSQGFLLDDPGAFDVAVVCLTSAYYSSYTRDEVARIVDFVNNGGGLLVMADQQAAPNANIQPIASPFGITPDVSNVVNDSPPYYDVSTQDLAIHPIFDRVREIFVYAAGELDVSAPALPVAWQEQTKKPIAAVAEYGQGRVVALGDSSIWSVSGNWDYFNKADNPQFSLNTFTYLAVPEPVTVLLLGLGSLVLIRKRRSC